MNTPKGVTADGFETQIGTNHFGHFALTCLLLDTIKSSAPAKIINVSSLAHKWGTNQPFFILIAQIGKMNWDDLMSEKSYSGFPAYCQSKLANVLFTKELARRLEGTGVTVNAVHPGVVATELGRHTAFSAPFNWFFGRTPEEGAKTTLWVALEAEGTGEYYADCKANPAAPQADKVEDQKKLWELSVKLTGLENKEL